MMIVRFRNNGEYTDLLKKVKKMRKFAEELEECLDDALYDEGEEPEYRSASHSKDYMEEDPHYRENRYSYRSGRR